MNLGAPLRLTISVSDASEEGGAAGEASKLLSSVGSVVGKRSDDLRMTRTEEDGNQAKRSKRCIGCNLASKTEGCPCPFKCGSWVCSVKCFWGRETQCLYKVIPHHSVGFFGDREEPQLMWDLLKNGFVVEHCSDKKSRHPKLSVAVCLPYFSVGCSVRRTWNYPEGGRDNALARNERMRAENKMAFRQGDIFKAQLVEGRHALIMFQASHPCWNLTSFRTISTFLNVHETYFSIWRLKKKEEWCIMHSFKSSSVKILENTSFQINGSEQWPVQFAQMLPLIFRSVLNELE